MKLDKYYMIDRKRERASERKRERERENLLRKHMKM